MIYYTGDTHGEVEKLIAFSERFHLTPEDTIVILGDAGWNYYTDKRDFLAKSFLKRLGVTIFSIHGNHEARPGKLSFYHEAEWRGGSVYVEDEFPNILFAKDGEVYPVVLEDAEEILARFDGTDYVGIVPHSVIPKYCEGMFPAKYGRVIDFMHVYDEEIEQYGSQIEWLPLEEAKLK